MSDDLEHEDWPIHPGLLIVAELSRNEPALTYHEGVWMDENSYEGLVKSEGSDV